MNQGVLGVDIGKVIIGGDNDTSLFTANYLATPPIQGAFEALRYLTLEFSGRVYLVSKCSPRNEARTREWLRHRKVYEMTGIKESSVKFCRYREAKRDICVELGITDFIDDRLENLNCLQGHVKNRYLFGSRKIKSIDGIIYVESWEEAIKEIKKG